MLVGKIVGEFSIAERGIAVIVEISDSALPADFRIKIGDPIEFRKSDQAVSKTTVAGIEHVNRDHPESEQFGLLVPVSGTNDSLIGLQVYTL